MSQKYRQRYLHSYALMSTFKRLMHSMSQNIDSSDYMKHLVSACLKMLAVVTYMKHSLHGICLKNIDNSI